MADDPAAEGSANRPPEGREPAVRTLAMPADTNPHGDIFGGWLMAQMDIAGGTVARDRAEGRVATVAIAAMEFHQPVFVGDVVSCYAEVVGVGRTSINVRIETFARRGRETVQVTAGLFVYVALDDNGKPRPVPEA